MAKTEKEKKYRKSQEKEAAKIEMVSKLAKRKKEGKYFPKNVDGTKATDTRAALNLFKVQKMMDKEGGEYDGISDRRLASKEGSMRTGGLSSGQATIAAKAPPRNKIDGKDFKVLREEKAKGRGMGLQDESVQPGKVMKAKMGVATDYKKYLKGLKKATDSVKKDKENKFIKRRMKLMGMPKLSKGMGPAGAAGPSAGRPSGRRPMTQGPKGGIGSMPKKRDSSQIIVMTKDGPKRITIGRSELDNVSAIEQKMGGGMMKARRGRIVDDQKRDKRNPNRKPSTKIFDKIGDILKTPYYIRGGKKEKKMGGGMIAPSQRPGYSKGTMVKARGCKLGRTRPTKIT